MLVEASAQQQQARDRLTASAWGRGLTVEQFCAREAGLRAHHFARASMRTWLWSRDGDVVSSCETFEVPARRGARSGRAFVVASVFTEERLRGQGFAVAMLRALLERLAAEGALAVALFSEVGGRIYERAGFHANPGHDVVVPAAPGPLPVDVALELGPTAPGRAAARRASGSDDAAPELEPTRPAATAPASDDDTRELEPTPRILAQAAAAAASASSDDDVRALEPTTPGRAAAGSSDGSADPASNSSRARERSDDAIVLELTAAQCDWHVERERLYASLLHRPGLEGHVLRAGNSTLTLAASFQTNEAHVLWYDFEREADAVRLINAAAALAARAGLDAVRLWEVDPLPMLPGAARVKRNDELPMLCALDGSPHVWSRVHRGLWA